MRTLRLLELHPGADCLVARCALDDARFQVTVWYEDVDIARLARQHGDHFERLALHVALFQLNAACSLKPEVIELGPYARFLTQDLVDTWRTVFRNVWAQWRYEHDLPAYEGPRFVDPIAAAPSPIAVPDGPVELLAFGGGGKDSLVAAKLLERGGLPFATLGYSHSVYGAAEPQHALLDRVGVATARVRAERQWILDDLLDAPIARLRPALGVKYILAAETPASVFAALPLALARGYRGLVVAHEAGANAPQLTWHGEGVNHQWGKGWEAEQLLDGYVRRALLSNVRYFSLLQPIHDELIFELLARDAQLATLTHSCNVQKPWCARCAKCVYVWLQMAAHLAPSIVDATFRKPVDVPENDHYFRELLGLAEHTPFECVGSVPEARLALAQAIPKFPALARFVVEAPDPRPLLAVGDTHGMPPHVAACVMPQFHEAAASAAQRLL